MGGGGAIKKKKGLKKKKKKSRDKEGSKSRTGIMPVLELLKKNQAASHPLRLGIPLRHACILIEYNITNLVAFFFFFLRNAETDLTGFPISVFDSKSKSRPASISVL